jgi:hypothetical protein
LKVIFETISTGLGAVAEGVFQGGLDLIGCGEADAGQLLSMLGDCCLVSKRWEDQMVVAAQGCHPHDPASLDFQEEEEVDSSIEDNWRRRA